MYGAGLGNISEESRARQLKTLHQSAVRSSYPNRFDYGKLVPSMKCWGTFAHNKQER